MAAGLTVGEQLPLHADKCGVGLSWAKEGKAIDLDLQGVIVNNKGCIIDAVYYNNLKALRAVTHSGDEQTGEKTGMDEVVWVTFSKLPIDVKLIIFVVAAYCNGHLRDVKDGSIHILESTTQNEVARYALEHSEEEVDAVAMFVKSDSGEWRLHVIDEPAQDGQHFIDILEPTLGNLIRGIVPSAPSRQKVAFAMDKGAVMDLSANATSQNISACLGWDVDPVGGNAIDLDVSVIFMSKDGKCLGAVFFGNTEEFGVKHSGDNLTGAGEGDDEIIYVSLDKVARNVEQMFFVVNIYSKGVSFDKVSNAYCRICDESGNEMARYVLREGRGQSGLMMSRLFREPGNTRWGFQALGLFCNGRNYKESLPDVYPIFHKSARELQMRGMTTITAGPQQFSEAPAGPPQPTATEVAATPTAQQQQACCLVQ